MITGIKHSNNFQNKNSPGDAHCDEGMNTNNDHCPMPHPLLLKWFKHAFQLMIRYILMILMTKTENHCALAVTVFPVVLITDGDPEAPRDEVTRQ